MFGAIGSALGSVFGKGTEAKGYKKAGEYYDQLRKEAGNARSYADPYGTQEGNYRGYQADYLQDLLTGKARIQEDPGYQYVYDESMRAVSRKNASQGYGWSSAESGNVGAALQDRAANVASQQYDTIIARLMELSGANSGNAVQGASIYGNMTSQGAAGQASAVLGKYTALGQRSEAMGTAVGSIVDVFAGGLSDIRLKKDLNLIGMDGPLHKYEWTWNSKAEQVFGLTGKSVGYIAQEVQSYLPKAVGEEKGYLCLDYDYINTKLEELA
jgi:hypothetical protein